MAIRFSPFKVCSGMPTIKSSCSCTTRMTLLHFFFFQRLPKSHCSFYAKRIWQHFIETNRPGVGLHVLSEEGRHDIAQADRSSGRGLARSVCNRGAAAAALARWFVLFAVKVFIPSPARTGSERGRG
jgi:hypothetical protein